MINVVYGLYYFLGIVLGCVLALILIGVAAGICRMIDRAMYINSTKLVQHECACCADTWWEREYKTSLEKGFAGRTTICRSCNICYEPMVLLGPTPNFNYKKALNDPCKNHRAPRHFKSHWGSETKEA